MIRVIDVASKTRTPVPEGNARTVLGPSDEGTRVQVAIREVEPGKACRVGPSDKTQVVYILEGKGAAVAYTKAGRRRNVRPTGALGCTWSHPRRRP